LRQEKKAAAAKYIPYGFGPAKRTAFVIEEIGETSDDEEVYGDYQGARIEAGNEVKKPPKGKGWLDKLRVPDFSGSFSSEPRE
jgi:hypothetical protein